MEKPCNSYKSQYKKAKNILDILQKQKAEIELQLESTPYSADLHKDLRTVNMDIKITLNEMEFAEYCIQECLSNNKTSVN